MGACLQLSFYLLLFIPGNQSCSCIDVVAVPLICHHFSQFPAFETSLSSAFLLLCLIAKYLLRLNQSLYLPGSFYSHLPTHINIYLPHINIFLTLKSTDTHTCTCTSVHIGHYVYKSELISSAYFPISNNKLYANRPNA